MPGDVINMEVYAKYPDLDDKLWSDELRSLITSIAPAAMLPQEPLLMAAQPAASAAWPSLLRVFFSHTEEEGDGLKRILTGWSSTVNTIRSMGGT